MTVETEYGGNDETWC